MNGIMNEIMAQHGLSQSKYNLHCCADLQNNADYITHIIVPAYLTSCPTQPIAFLNFDSEKKPCTTSCLHFIHDRLWCQSTRRQAIPHDNSRQELSLRDGNVWIGPLECYGPKDFRGLMCEIKRNVIQGPKLR